MQVTADSLFEAAALALKAFREAHLIDATAGRGTHLQITAVPVPITHELHVQRLFDWLEGGIGGSPKEQALKLRLRSLLTQDS